MILGRLQDSTAALESMSANTSLEIFLYMFFHKFMETLQVGLEPTT